MNRLSIRVKEERGGEGKRSRKRKKRRGGGGGEEGVKRVDKDLKLCRNRRRNLNFY